MTKLQFSLSVLARTRIAITSLCAACVTTAAFGYGNDGHRTVGAIADKLIAGTPAVAHVAQLLGNQTLEQASTWADAAKYYPNSHDADMVAFIAANPHDPSAPSYNPLYDHWHYHYTDIPIQEPHYRSRSVGASSMDVVHMIHICVVILQGNDTPRTNPTHINQRVALRLLVHYMGDVHQPLHVGAAYFGPGATLVNPNSTPGAAADAGGNLVTFRGTHLHSYWDTPAVKNAMKTAHASNPDDFAAALMQQPPKDWKKGLSFDELGRTWADELLPIAIKAHAQLTFTQTNATTWAAHDTDAAAYDQWAAQQVSTEIARAGYRLAALLQKIWPQ
jgi:S1/P1 nuclease